MRWTIWAVCISLMMFPVASTPEEIEESQETLEEKQEVAPVETTDENKEEKDLEHENSLRIKKPDITIKGGSLEWDFSRKAHSPKLPKAHKISPEGWGIWFGPDVMFLSPDLSDRLEPMTDYLDMDDFDDSMSMMGLRMMMTLGHNLAVGTYYQIGSEIEDELVDGEQHEATINMSMFGLLGQVQYPIMSQGRWEDLTGRLKLLERYIIPSCPPSVILGSRFGMGGMTLVARGDDLFEDTETGTEFLTQIAPYAGMMIPLHKSLRAEAYVGYNYIEFSTGTANFEMDDEKMISGKNFDSLIVGITISCGVHFEGKEKSSESK